MAHDKVYGICENKCRVRLPRIFSFKMTEETHQWSTWTLTANSNQGKMCAFSEFDNGFERLENKDNWTIVASIQSDSKVLPSFVSVRANIFDETSFQIFFNATRDITLTAGTIINVTLIENV